MIVVSAIVLGLKYMNTGWNLLIVWRVSFQSETLFLCKLNLLKLNANSQLIFFETKIFSLKCLINKGDPLRAFQAGILTVFQHLYNNRIKTNIKKCIIFFTLWRDVSKPITDKNNFDFNNPHCDNYTNKWVLDWKSTKKFSCTTKINQSNFNCWSKNINLKKEVLSNYTSIFISRCRANTHKP